MKKFITVLTAAALLVSLAVFVSAGTKDVGTKLDDFRASEGALTETDKGILLTNPNKANSAVYAALKEPVELDGLTFTITPTMWSAGHRLSFCLSDKADFTPGATNVGGFGHGLMVICQYVVATDYMCIVPYSINEKGFAVEGADLGVIASEYMFSTEPITISIKKDASFGYAIYANDKKLVVADGGADMDLNFLSGYFTDGKAYLGFDMWDGNGSDRDPDTILIGKISVSDGVVEEPSSAAPASSETAPASSCGNKA